MTWREWLENQLEDDDGVAISVQTRDRIADTLLVMPVALKVALVKELNVGWWHGRM